MQNSIRKISPSTKNITQHCNENLIAQQGIVERMKPFVSLTFFTAEDISNTTPFSLIAASGQAIITYVISGEALYVDSTGKRGVLKKGGWSWVIAGAGIVYSIEPKTSDYLSIQLCIALSPALENSPPQSAYLEPSLMAHAEPAEVLIGRDGNNMGEFALPSLMNYLVVQLSSKQNWIYELPINHHKVWIAVVSGSLVTDEGEIAPNEVTLLKRVGRKIRVYAATDTVFVLGSTQEFMHDLIFHKHSVHTSIEALQLGLKGITAAEKSLAIS
jgi:redox-sensitive bicupin YhaK (pirin superfamily)